MEFIMNDVGILVLHSPSLSYADKQEMVKKLPSLSQDQLKQMKQVFEEEAEESKKIEKKEISMWTEFKAAISAVKMIMA